MRQSTFAILIMLGVTVVMFFSADTVACPLCAENLPADEQAGKTAQGFYWSILFMMSVPFLLAGGFGGTLWYVSRKNAMKHKSMP